MGQEQYLRLQEVLRNPAANQEIMAVLMGVALLMVLLVLLVGVMLLWPAVRRRPRTSAQSSDVRYDEQGRPYVVQRVQKQRSRRSLLVGWSVAVGIVLLGLAVTYVTTGTNGFCATSCHAEDEFVMASDTDVHATRRCVDCHEPRLPLGAFEAMALRAGHLYASYVSSESVGSAPIPASRCLGCHEVIETEIVTSSSGVRVSHAEPLAAGMVCVDCHVDTGHGTLLVDSVMSRCIRCHDGDQAAAECDACHGGRPADSARIDASYPKLVTDPVIECGGCHDQGPCDACHGLRMPHPAEFVEYAHARDAAFEKKEQKCFTQCHDREDCLMCHVPFEAGDVASHPEDWKARHARAPSDSPCDCHQDGLPQGQTSFCDVCH